MLRINKGAVINVDNIHCKLFYHKVVLFFWKPNIECFPISSAFTQFNAQVI